LQFFPRRVRGNLFEMLRKVMWTAMSGLLTAMAAMGARRAASRLWRIATGEEPPAKK
jgi:hypothetical protein